MGLKHFLFGGNGPFAITAVGGQAESLDPVSNSLQRLGARRTVNTGRFRCFFGAGPITSKSEPTNSSFGLDPPRRSPSVLPRNSLVC